MGWAGAENEDSQPLPALGFLGTLSATFWVSVVGGPALAVTQHSWGLS